MKIEIDGAGFNSLESFYSDVSRKMIPGIDWGKNLDAFNDLLRGGFGMQQEGFILIWRNYTFSQQCLGYEETVRQLELMLEKCHSSLRQRTMKNIESARNGVGPTVFDSLVTIIEENGIRIHNSEEISEFSLSWWIDTSG